MGIYFVGSPRLGLVIDIRFLTTALELKEASSGIRTASVSSGRDAGSEMCSLPTNHTIN